ncbi:MAG: AMP-binding protein [Acetobacteraceae bacterium]|nr:AMP-binding protein [Acetobacteraceae bacterium]
MSRFAGQDIGTLLRAQASARRDKTFLIWAPFEGAERRWTYGEFVARAEGVATGLWRRGVRPGDRVLIYLENCPEALLAWFGCAILGAVAVTVNARCAADELAYLAGHSRVVGAITQPRLRAALSESAPGLGFVAVTETDCGEAPSAPPAVSERFAALDGDPALLPPRAADPAAPFGVQYTSGTTSHPKAVLWTHANALWGARVSAAHEQLREDDVHLVTMPLYHTNAQCYSVLASLWAGATCVLQPRFSASRFWQVAVAHRCTWTSIVPFCAKALSEQEVPPKHWFRHWGNAYCAPPEDERFRVHTIGWWGMTETVTHGIVGKCGESNAPLSMGRAAPEYEVRLLNEGGAPAEPGEVGDLAIRGVRGISLFAEYLDDQAATEAAFDASGFLLTGDRALRDQNGFLYFVDRAKDLLKVGGENVSPAQIERVILDVPGVLEAAVVGRSHPMLDEVPVAFVRPADPADPTLTERITGACVKSLAAFSVPREIRVLDDFPRVTLQKVSRQNSARCWQGTRCSWPAQGRPRRSTSQERRK